MTSCTMIPRFVELAGNGLFSVSYIPSVDGNTSRWVLHFPAFGEEMNKSRAMVAEQSRVFAGLGYGVLCFDYSGTGDSPGSLADADWVQWRAQALAALAWLELQGAESIVLWGLRLGGLMALNILASPEPPLHLVHRVILWNPVQNGRQFMNQFLRLRLAAGIFQDRAAAKESMKDLRNVLDQGNILEVAGYPLNRELVAQIEALDAASMTLPGTVKIHWLDVSSKPEQKMVPAVERVVESWKESGIQVNWQPVRGDAFWTTQEIAMAPGLIQVTASILPAVTANENVPIADSDSSATSSNEAVEIALTFKVGDCNLLGILHRGSPGQAKGVVLVVGGPQYRVGSHRQFVQLARELAASGVPVLRFDYRGMGDSEGKFLGFEAISDDIAMAVDELVRRCPGVSSIIVWGLCDAATAAVQYAPDDKRVTGLVLLNPWVRSEAGEARARLKHYYLQRLLSGEFWRKLFSGRFNVRDSLNSLFAVFNKLLGANARKTNNSGEDIQFQAGYSETLPLSKRFEEGLGKFRGKVLLILSGNDLTAAEFTDEVNVRRKLRGLLMQPLIRQKYLKEADHTFSRSDWKQQVVEWTQEWIEDL